MPQYWLQLQLSSQPLRMAHWLHMAHWDDVYLRIFGLGEGNVAALFRSMKQDQRQREMAGKPLA